MSAMLLLLSDLFFLFVLVCFGWIIGLARFDFPPRSLHYFFFFLSRSFLFFLSFPRLFFLFFLFPVLFLRLIFSLCRGVFPFFAALSCVPFSFFFLFVSFL